MAVCKRCGKTFDYQKREGVCPKCCFYNRPANAWQEDDSWIKNYDYDDSEYSTMMESYEIEPEEQHSSEEMDGSHVHLPDGSIFRSLDTEDWKRMLGKGKRMVSAQRGARPAGRKKSKLRFVFIFLILYWIICVFMNVINIFL